MDNNIFTRQTAACMRLALESIPFDSDEYSYELRLRGVRALAYMDGRTTTIIDAANRPASRFFPELSPLHRQVSQPCIIDGVLVIGLGTDDEHRELLHRFRLQEPGTIARASDRRPAAFVALDLLYASGSLITGRPLQERQDSLRRIVSDSKRLFVVRSIEGRGIDFCRLVGERNLPGVVAKRADSPYLMGMESPDWLSLRPGICDYFVICGFTAGCHWSVPCMVLGQYDASGRLVYKGLLPVDEESMEFTLVAGRPHAPTQPFPTRPASVPKTTVWVLPTLVCRVDFQSWNILGHFHHPFAFRLCPDLIPYAASESSSA